MQLSPSPTPLVREQHLTANELKTLVPGMASGNETAYLIFFSATNGLLFGLLLRILGHTKTAEEVLDEVYDEVKRKASLFSKQNERPLTWLILIAHRRAVERLCCQPSNSDSLRHIENNEDSAINITEQRRLVRAALDAIPPLHHRMIEHAFFSGMTTLEIAQELGLSPAAVEGGIRYAMLQLFALFKSMGFTAEPAKPLADQRQT